MLWRAADWSLRSHKLRQAPFIGSHRIGSLGEGAAHYDVIGADGLGLGRGHDPNLVAHIAICQDLYQVVPQLLERIRSRKREEV